MTLSSMVVSRDWQEISVLECILGGLRIGVEVETEPDRAREKLDKSKIDALIVDCDLNGSSAFLRGVLEGDLQGSVPILIVGGSGGRSGLEAKGASFVFEKPISVEQAVHTLSAARNMILDGRLRYHRETLDLPVWLTAARKKQAKAHLMNLSRGGMGVHTRQPLPMSAPLRISFVLPGSKRSFKIQGAVVWMNRKGQAGIRFDEGNSRARRELQLWLERQYFAH